jgi:hypothetical protein
MKALREEIKSLSTKLNEIKAPERNTTLIYTGFLYCFIGITVALLYIFGHIYKKEDVILSGISISLAFISVGLTLFLAGGGKFSGGRL